MAEHRLSPKAQRDLDGIFDYTVEPWGRAQAQALRYIDGIASACANLAEAPRQSQDCFTIRPGYRRRMSGSTPFISERPATESRSSASCTSA